MKRKLLSLLMASVMAATVLVGCGSGGAGAGASTGGSGASTGGSGASAGAEASSDEWKWERKVEIICPWGTGGGADTTLRTFATALEKEICH